MTKNTYQIDGNNFSTLEEFYDVISRDLIKTKHWGYNLDAFNEVLLWTANSYKLTWINSEKSKRDLGYPETIRQLENRLTKCHPTNIPSVKNDLELAKQNKGPTVFDWLVEIINYNSDWVSLELK